MSEKINLADSKVFEGFFKENYRPLQLYALKFVSRSDVANDIVQEAFAKLWEQRESILITTSVKAYMYKVIHNSCLNFIEQIKLRGQHNEIIYLDLIEKELDYFNGEQSLIQKEDILTIQQAINELPEDYKEIVHLSRLQELKNKEISEKLNIPLRTVETRIYRAINKLRSVLSEKRQNN